MKDSIYDPTKRFKVPTYKDKKTKEIKIYSVYKDLYDFVMNDSWATICLWGKQRRGKSTVAIWLAYFLWRLIDPTLSEEELWNRVYDCIVFNLNQIVYKLDNPKMKRIWDLKHKHYRIPILIWDDFGVHSNKAITQHQPAWDEFKGSFDSLGTEFSILVFTMVNPDTPTAQLLSKYTHEILVQKRGVFKYDEVDWEQDFKGTRNRRKKVWKQLVPFKRIPDERFDPYDKMRNELAKESKQRVKDKMMDGIPFILKCLHPEDITILSSIVETGPIPQSKRVDLDKKAVLRLKAHQLVTPSARKGNNYSLDITSLGLDLLRTEEKES